MVEKGSFKLDLTPSLDAASIKQRHSLTIALIGDTRSFFIEFCVTK
jgi:hypothetical protein